MENVIITETRGGNPKYYLEDLGITIRIELRKSEPSAHIKLSSKEIKYAEITGKDIKSQTNTVHIKSVPVDAYPIFCESLINHMRSLAAKNMNVTEIIKEIYDQYHNETETKKEVVNLQEKFKKLNKEVKQKIDELNELSKEMDYLCKQMEML